jgi:hypothetical protein
LLYVHPEPTGWARFSLRRGAVYSKYTPAPEIEPIFETQKALIISSNIDAPYKELKVAMLQIAEVPTTVRRGGK